jgi:transcriptional regulator with XRE-family HTH domain
MSSPPNPGQPRRTRGKPDAIDIHVGTRLRQRRTLLGMSQEKLGEALGLTFQQVQKYERGANRIGAGRLHQIADVLGVTVAFFFEDMPPRRSVAAGSGDARLESDAPEERHSADDQMARRETLELVRAYYRIADPRLRRRLYDLVKAIGRLSPA